MSEVVAPITDRNEQNTSAVNRLRRMVADDGNRFLTFIFGGNAVALFGLVAYIKWIK